MTQRRILVSPLHTKGLLTLSLVLLAEQLAFTRAARVWNVQHAPPGAQQEECRDNPVAAPTFAPRSPKPGGLGNVLGRWGKRLTRNSSWRILTKEECCRDCWSCLGDKSISKSSCDLPHVPRGGGVADEVVASAVVSHKLPLNAWKVLFQAFLTTINVLCWYIPLKNKKISENKLALSLANAFSGGVFLSLAFGHLIPECVHGFEGYPQYNEVTPYLLVLAGYLLIFFVEKVAFDAHDILHEMEHKHDSRASNGSISSANGDSGASSGRSAVILLGALAVHSILEMTALGLADTFGDAAILTLSIALHQPAESIALLVAFLKSGMPHNQILTFLSIFSLMGPIGVAIGMAVNEFAAPVVDAMMVAIVAGTFVYVGATEVIPEEWEDSSHKWAKFAALMTGIVSIFVITQYTMSLEL